jgi:hypothetical protein
MVCQALFFCEGFSNIGLLEMLVTAPRITLDGGALWLACFPGGIGLSGSAACEQDTDDEPGRDGCTDDLAWVLYGIVFGRGRRAMCRACSGFA